MSTLRCLRDDPRAFVTEGGGSRGYPRISLYLLLAVKQLKIDAEIREAVDEFLLVAKFANQEIGGEVADLDNDNRVRRSLGSSKEGIALFERVEKLAPVICVSNSYIGNPANTHKVELIEFKTFRSDAISYVSQWTARAETSSGERGVRGLREILLLWNKMIILRPTLFGVGINLNEAIEQALKGKLPRP